MNFKITNKNTYTIIEFTLDSIISPSDLKTLKPPDPIKNNLAQNGVIISGKGPIWLYGYLVHYYHATKWVATYDPRLGGAVVVESHTPDVDVGDIIQLE